MIDIITDYQVNRNLAITYGLDAFMEYFNGIYPQYGFYSCSSHWIEDEKYICKLKGTGGDLVIGWIGVHDGKREGEL